MRSMIVFKEIIFKLLWIAIEIVILKGIFSGLGSFAVAILLKEKNTINL